MIIIRAVVRDLYDGAIAAKMLAYTFVRGSIMPIAAPIIGGYITVWLGWKPNFYVIGGTGLFVLLSIWFWLDETSERDYEAINIRGMGKSFVKLIQSRVFLAYAYTAIGPYAGLYAILTALSSILIEFMEVSPTIFGYLFAIIMLGNLAASLLAGRLVTALGEIPLIYTGCTICLLSGIVAASFAWQGVVTPTDIVVPSLGFMIGFALLIPAATAGAMSPFPEMAGRTSSIIGLVHYSAGAITSLLMGLMADGTHIPLVNALIICGILTFLSIWPIYKTHKN
jgi:DHA1 family bicyclomycin/chloramphenicol resistance-like MFS transporter